MSKHNDFAAKLLNSALKTEYGVYNVKNGRVIFPDMNSEGLFYGFQTGTVPLKVLVEAQKVGTPVCADEYAVENFPAPGTCAENRLDFISEYTDNLVYGQNWHDVSKESTACDMVLSILDEDFAEGAENSPWCISDFNSIAEKAQKLGLPLYD